MPRSILDIRSFQRSNFVVYLPSFCEARYLDISPFRRIPKILSDEFVLEIFWSVLEHRHCICVSKSCCNYIRSRIKFFLHNIIKKYGTGFGKFNTESDSGADAHILQT